jgi:uncharacterized protein YndB with AHSA1/START domain
MCPDAAVVEICRHLDAAPERVFRAFTDPALVSRWLKPAPEIGLSVLQLDFCVGGGFRFAYAVPGGQTMFVNGVYRTIEPPTRIVFSWNIEPPDEHAGVQSEVTVGIAADGDGTELRIRHVNLSRPGAAARHTQGWHGALDQLTALVGTGEAEHGRR